MQPTRYAAALALLSTGSKSEARMAMMAMTTNSSIKVKPARRERFAPNPQRLPARNLPGLCTGATLAGVTQKDNCVFERTSDSAGVQSRGSTVSESVTQRVPWHQKPKDVATGLDRSRQGSARPH